MTVVQLTVYPAILPKIPTACSILCSSRIIVTCRLLVKIKRAGYDLIGFRKALGLAQRFVQLKMYVFWLVISFPKSSSLREADSQPISSAAGLPGHRSTTWLKWQRNKLPNNLSTWWMGAQAKQQETLSSCPWLLPPPHFVYLVLHLYNLGTTALFHQDGENPTSGPCPGDGGPVLELMSLSTDNLNTFYNKGLGLPVIIK